jgi:molecular chaperone HtpG
LTVSTEERKFQIHLEGLIQLLAQNLYAVPDVFLREMIQNAHDSIKKRALADEESGRGLQRPWINVVASKSAKTIEIHDNGSGMTREEIDFHLAMIGRSGTGELQDQLGDRIREGDRTGTVQLIGQFGIGLLSAFIVARRVTVLTKAADHDAQLWESWGGQTYTVSESERAEVGTTVTLYLRDDHERYLDRGLLRSIIRTYVDFIGMPVHLDDDVEPANAINGPWHRSYSSDNGRDRAYHEFWERRSNEKSLHVFAIAEAGAPDGASRPDSSTPPSSSTSIDVRWRDGLKPDGWAWGRVRGMLAITGSGTGTVDVYIKRMFINTANREVLPAWAKFLHGVVECNELTPNVARDDVVRNAALAAVRDALGGMIVDELTNLHKRDRERFVEIMRMHAYHVLV